MSTRHRLQGCFLLLFVFLYPMALIARNLIRVDEGKTRLASDGRSSILKLALASDFTRDVPVHIDVEVLDTDDRVIEAVSRDSILHQRSKQLDIPLSQSFSQINGRNDVNPIWRRVRYRVTVTDPEQNPAEARGVISVSELGSEPFAMRVGVPSYLTVGARCRVHVFTQHPTSGRPVGNVDIAATLTISGGQGQRVLNSAGRSNSSGYLALDFEIPPNLDDPGATIEIKAKLGGFVRELIEDLDFNDRTEILISTDKPIYQPGQRLRIRVLAFDASRRALAKVPVELSVHDPESSIVYRTESITSQFGEADAEWAIPDNVRLGDYVVEAGPSDSSQSAAQSVKISRYDLPGFTITPTSDRRYYLPNQNARVEVRADYLFGRPVKQGHIRVVRETRRHWSYRNQNWETEEGSAVAGELDSQGRFLANIDLQEEHDRLASRDYQMYSDLQYAAYVTDATTNRTEQRRFELRLSKEPIHIYVSEGSNANGFPLEFYLSTFYADGSPAKSRVSIYEVPSYASRRMRESIESGAQFLRTISTNRYGVARVTGLRSDSSFLLFTAEDGKGGHGQHAESFWLRESAVRVYTNKTLYRRGDPLEVEVRSTFANGAVVLEVLREEKVLHSRVLSLRNGKAFTVIPYADDFKDDVIIGAYYAGNRYNSETFGTRTVAYPRNRELKIDTRLDQPAYAPGDEATVAFRVRTPEGLAKPSLLGVVVLDKAIEERARTDNEFGRAHWFCEACFGWIGSDGQLSGLNRRDLDRLDLTQPLPGDLEIAAEVLLNSGFNSPFYSRLIDDDDTGPEHVFKSSIQSHLNPLKDALDERFLNGGKHPADEASLRELLALSGLKPESFRDPWDTPYRPSFSIAGVFDIMELQSAGPDKRFGSSDDFTALRLMRRYFQPYGEIIDKAVRNYHQRTGDFIRDSSTLKSELLSIGENPDSWRDRWGQLYRFDFGIFRTLFVVSVRSSGPNRVFETSDTFPSDDIPIWTSNIDYTAGVRKTLQRVVDKFYQETKTFPETAAQFDEAVQRDGASESSLLDPWMHRYYPSFKTEHYYSDRVAIITYEEYLRGSSQRTSVVPVTSKIQFLLLRSAGPDGVEGTSDDFDVTAVSRMLAEQSAQDATPQADANAPVLQGFTGAIRGLVVDATSARIPGVRIEARSSTQGNFQTVSDDMGAYLFRNLPPGLYEVSFELPGFMRRIIQEVPVQSSAATDLTVTLQVGSFAQTIEVAAETQLSLAAVSSSVAVTQERPSVKPAPSISTPRLREYFPETLFWQPAIETDRSGRAQVKFKLADNITTWKMAAIVSTSDGQIGMIEKEIVSFQPFFLEHDPPKILTEGDEIALPVVVRSYLDKDQSVDLALKPDNWFAPLNGTARNISIKAGDTVRETFAFKALASKKDARQQITARGSRASDSIEKPVTVRPDGEEMTHASSEIFRNAVAHSIVVPLEMIPNTMRAELKIYPNLMAHLVDGIEGILQRPYGCAEQTISSAYPSLMLLRYYKESGRESPALAAKARRYLQSGLDRLRAYQGRDGGFSYWGQGAADVAVTAYAVRFLNDAAEFASADQGDLRRAYEWLEREQKEDGSWDFQNSLTALVARTLSQPGLRDAISSRRPAAKTKRDSVADALTYLRKRTDEFEDPYTLASLAIAASNTGNAELLNAALSRLEHAAHKERDGAYWDLQTNTPFYGWGLAGRVETTALAVRALAGARKQGDSESLINQGLLFLLRSKDRFGVWHSTQATVNALDALISLVEKRDQDTGTSPADVIVNGSVVTSVTISKDNQPADAIVVDLSEFLASGVNHVEIRGATGAAATVQFLETYYIPWTHSAEGDVKPPSDSASALRLAVRFDRTEGRAGDEIVCRVEAERAGFRGYGMMLAEIGLPPGAEVDRASLEGAIKAGNWDLYRYDVLPDRLIAYVWPRAGGTQFNFKFHLRYGINAQSPASRLYDYYNPDAQTTVRPVRFKVR